MISFHFANEIKDSKKIIFLIKNPKWLHILFSNKFKKNNGAFSNKLKIKKRIYCSLKNKKIQRYVFHSCPLLSCQKTKSNDKRSNKVWKS